MTNDTETIPAATDLNPDGFNEIARLVASRQDALTDDIVNRVSSTMSEGITLLDRLTRNKGLMRLLQVLDHPESQALLIAASEALRQTSRQIAPTAPATGGLFEMLNGVRDPGTQEGVRILSLLGQHLSASLREQHRLGNGQYNATCNDAVPR